MALFVVPFTCVWSGISLGGIYGRQVSSGQFDPTSSLFGLPFLIGSVFLIGYCAMTTMGNVELSQRADSLTVLPAWVSSAGRVIICGLISGRRERTAAGTDSTGIAKVWSLSWRASEEPLSELC